MRKFLSARWQDLVMANYKVSPEVLREFVPRGTELDFWQGECYASLVAFKFQDTAVLNFRIPFHVNFEEINLRFYVRRETAEETRRGVVFVKEIVPRLAICLVANTLYGEKYEAWRTGFKETEKDLSYFWTRGDCSNKITVELGQNLGVPEIDSHAEFIIEHYWGYTRLTDSKTGEYKVEHPKWELKEIEACEINVNFAATYGAQFAFLNDAEPRSILFAAGSEISVYKGAKLVL
jgi:uncharacterized protein YqjF (DUF2071 family)